MPGARVTDPELLRLLEAPAAPEGRRRVTDPDLLRQLNGVADAHPMTLADGTRPPEIGGGPQDAGTTAAALRGVLNGIPVVGPSIVSGVERAAAGIGALRDDARYSDTLSEVQANSRATAEAHPYVTTGSEIVGGALGTLPLVAAAPAAFGAGAGALPLRMGASWASGATIGGADAAVRSGGDWDKFERGTIAGGALGGVAPALGAAIGTGARAIAQAVGSRAATAPGVGSAAMGKLAEDVGNGGGPAAIQSRMRELGPEAMLLDASPSLEGRAQGLAVLPDTREAITRPLTERARGANARLGDDVNRHLGPTLDPEAFRAGWQQAYGEAVPPLYREALGQPVTVDTSGILATIGRLGEHEKGGADMALRRAWRLLHQEAEVPGVGRALIPDRHPEALHNAKEALDAMIAQVQAQQGSAAASELRALSAVRSGVNEALEAQVPGYSQANRTAQHFFQQRDAFERGQTLLNGGREAARPAQLAAETAEMTPEVAQAQRLGLRAEVDRAVGTTLNDRVALQKTIQGEGDWNRARLATVFGDEPTAGVVGAVERERAFDASHNRIVNNSMTELRKRAADDVAPREVSGGSADPVPGMATAIGGTTAGMTALGAKAAIKGGKLAVSAAQRQADLARNQQLAQAVTSREGEMLDRLLAAITARAEAERVAGHIGNAANFGTNALVRSQSERARPYIPFGFPALPLR